MNYDAIVIGTSAGGLNALAVLLSKLPCDFSVPIFIVQHLAPDGGSYLVEYLKSITSIPIKEAESQETITAPMVYIAPPNYHMLLDRNNTIVLSTEGKVNYSRPSIDPLFDSAAEIYHERLIGVILTGANSDGSDGLKRIKELGGLAIVQNLSESEATAMPLAAMLKTHADYILDLEDIAKVLKKII